MAADLTSFDQQTSGTRVIRGRRCGGSLWHDLRQSEQVAKQVASAQYCVASAARKSLALKQGAIPARASKLRALKHGAICAKASESGHLKRSFSRPPVAIAQT